MNGKKVKYLSFLSRLSKRIVEREFCNSKVIRDMNFEKLKAYEIISYEERIGIIYDKVQGESLLDWVMETGDLEGCAGYMAKLHKSIIQNKISNVPDYKEFLKWNVLNAPVDNSKKR